MLPPRHRIDHRPIYIHPSDPAWDNDKIAADQRAIEAKTGPWSRWEDHPVHAYHAGSARYDKATVEPWLRSDVRPTMFVLRRMNRGQMGEFRHLRYDIGHTPRSEDFALRHCLVSIHDLDGIGEEWGKRSTDAPPLTDAQHDELALALGYGVLAELVTACVLASQQITSAEGK